MTKMNRKQLKRLYVKPKAHEKFMIDCIKNDLNQEEMFEEYQEAFRRKE